MKQKIKWNVIALTLIFPLIATLIILCSYGTVKNQVNYDDQHTLETETSLNILTKGNYVLYKSLYEKETGQSIPYYSLYINDVEKVLEGQYDLTDEEEYIDSEKYLDSLLRKNFERDFSEMIKFFDFYAENTETEVSISNTNKDKFDNPEQFCFFLEFVYDANGTPSIVKAISKDSDQLRRNASECILIKNQLLADSISGYSGFSDMAKADLLQEGKAPRNCKFIYAMTEDTLHKYQDTQNSMFRYYLGSEVYRYYVNESLSGFITIAFLIIMLLEIVLPLYRKNGKPFYKSWYFHLPLELLAMIIIILVGLLPDFMNCIIRLVNGYSAKNLLTFIKLSENEALVLSYILHGILLMLIYMLAWFIGLNLRPLREMGLRQYIKSSSLLYRIFPFCKKRLKKVYYFLEHLDVSKKASGTILKIVIINGIILLLISILWLGGIMFAIVYSIILYIVLRIYVSRMQKKYSIMLDKINEISAGNLNVKIEEDLGIFNPFKEQLLNIEEGFRTAVEEEVKSQKLKSELITNVSHDLKTPLTAIITYVSLLKDANLTDETRMEYLDTLEKKSLRLKVLIEDLFEVSKATSGNVTLHLMDVDIISLLKQVALEMSDKLNEADLDIRMDLPEEKVICSLDSQKTYRIYANLFSNICKYSLPGTRVYVHSTITDKEVIISMKNISATEITVEATQLTERFVRGDASRNTEGSGLGLAIVKSFVELQGGKFVLENDGDLFKAVTSFQRKI